MKRNSLSFTLTIYSVVMILFAFLIFAGTLYGLLQSSFSEQDNNEIRDRVQTLHDLVEQHHGDLSLLRHRVEQEWPRRRFERIYVRLIDENGQRVTETPSELTERVFAKAGGPAAEGALQTISLDAGVFLLGQFQIITSDAHPFQLQIAIDRTNEANLMQSFWRSIPLVMLLVIIGCVFLSRVIVRQALGPVEDISKSAANVNSETLKERIELENLPIELHGLGSTLNLMLNRLEESFDRLTKFSEDMAHELRTPVNNLMGTFSVAVGRPRSTEEYEAVLASGIEECERIKRIIESLLFISKSQDPSQSISLTEVKPSEEIAKIAGFYQVLAQEAGVELITEIHNDKPIPLDLTLFQRATGNLVTNAIRHTPKGGKIRIGLSHEKGFAVLSMKDEGVGIDPVSMNRIGQRFFRVDPSRSKTSGGTGLGLSIVKSIMHLHHGTFEMVSRVGQGTEVRLGFPLSRNAIGPS